MMVVVEVAEAEEGRASGRAEWRDQPNAMMVVVEVMVVVVGR